MQLATIDSSKPPIYVSLFNGQSRYMGGDHLYFAIPAILCLVIIILPPLLILLIEPLLITYIPKKDVLLLASGKNEDETIPRFIPRVL